MNRFLKVSRLPRLRALTMAALNLAALNLALVGPALLVACEPEQDVNNSHGTLIPIRGQSSVDEANATHLNRVATGNRISVGPQGLSRLLLDLGPSLLLDKSTEVVLQEATGPGQGAPLEIVSGRVFARAAGTELLVLTTPNGELRVQNASLSVEVEGTETRLYVIDGEVSYTQGEGEDAERGRASAGEELQLSGQGANISAATLWRDWTGGLAQPGPAGGDGRNGLGTLEARVPDEIGQARWPLLMRRLDVRVRIEGQLAITEVDQLFFNPASESVEGLYRVALPEGAVLQRFAVDRDNRLVDGYVYERRRAQQAYQQQVYRGSTEDPALLEWSAPGSYRAKIYPITAGQTRRIVIRYAQWLRPASEGGPMLYRYRMAAGGRPTHIQEFSLSVDLEESEVREVRAGMGAEMEEGALRIRRSDFRPRSDFWMELTPAQNTAQRAYVADHEAPTRAPGTVAPQEADERDYFYLPLMLPESLADTSGDSEQGLDLVIVADASAATDRSRLELGRSVVESVTAQLGPEDRVAVVSSDLTIRSVIPGEQPRLDAAEPAWVESLLGGLARIPRGGATDLGAALTAAAELLEEGGRRSAILYVGDGAPTVGELSAQGLLDRLARMPQPARLYAVGVGNEANLELLSTLTRGGGLSRRVEERAEAADVALEILAHAGRPVLHSVEVHLGDGIDNIYPRRPMDAVLGDVFPVTGRVRDSLPTEVRVTGVYGAEPFEQTVTIQTRDVDASTDLRLRWAAERLRELLLSEASREEVVELGTRYGLITPFTSFYVPSRRELNQMGGHASNLLDQPLLPIGGVDTPWRVYGEVALGLALAPLSLTGCSELSRSGDSPGEIWAQDEESRAMAAPTSTASAADEGGRMGAAPMADEAMAEPEPEMAQQAMEEVQNMPVAVPAAAAPMPSAPSGAFAAGSNDSMAALGALGPADMLDDGFAGGEQGEGGGLGGLALHGTGRGGGGTGEGTIGLGDLGTVGHGAGGGSGSGYGRGAGLGSLHAAGGSDTPSPRRTRRRPRSRNARDMRQEENREGEDDGRADPNVIAALQGALAANSNEAASGGRFERQNNATPVAITTVIVHTSTAADHARSRCSDASRASLSDRRALWRERLSAQNNASAWIRLYRQAIRGCEARNWRARRAFLGAMLNRAGSIEGMLQIYSLLAESGPRVYLRNRILARVRTPADLQRVRQTLGLGQGVDWERVEQILARAPNADAKITALRLLSMQYSQSFELKLRLMRELEDASRDAEAKRLADRMRVNPLADAGVRTAIGEMFLRMEREDEARRVFSEIVEFSPLDELARRRLGDIYRAHSWHEDAYRQYETLREIRPDDMSVLLLLAQAAAGAGRIDEALRLEQELMQTGQAGSSQGLSRTALLWSSVRFAQLKKAAESERDTDRLRALSRRIRRSGVLREAGDMRVTLTWAHPDANLSLWAAHPGLSLSRPVDLAPQYGIEAFDVDEQEETPYQIEVRCGGDRRTPVQAQLTVVWNEGEEDEVIEIIALSFDSERSTATWTLSGHTIVSVDDAGEAR